MNCTAIKKPLCVASVASVVAVAATAACFHWIQCIAEKSCLSVL